MKPPPVLQMLNPAELVLDPGNIRDDETPDPEMVESVRTHGVVMPLLVHLHGGKHHVIAGHRRLRAAREARLKFVPCIVHKSLDPVGRLSMQIVENLHRVDLNPIEKARALKRLQAEAGLKSQAEVAKVAGVSQVTVSRLFQALQLPTGIQARIARGEIGLQNVLARRSGKRGRAGDAGLRAAAISDPMMSTLMSALRKLGVAVVDKDEDGKHKWAARAHDALRSYLPGGYCGKAKGEIDEPDEFEGPSVRCDHCKERQRVEAPFGAESRIRAMTAHFDKSPECWVAHRASRQKREAS